MYLNPEILLIRKVKILTQRESMILKNNTFAISGGKKGCGHSVTKGKKILTIHIFQDFQI